LNNLNHVQNQANNTFEQSVYAQFPACLHEHVEHELFYNGVELEEGKLTIEEFTKGVLDMALWWEADIAKQANDRAIFNGIQELLDQGTFKDASQIATLTHELERGEESLLARFIGFQSVKNSLDAALSFLAWQHMQALVELEEEFNICLDHMREAKEPEFYGTSESTMTIINFSVMSQQ